MPRKKDHINSIEIVEWDEDFSLVSASRILILFQYWLEKQWKSKNKKYVKYHSLSATTYFTPRKGYTVRKRLPIEDKDESNRSRALILHHQLTTEDEKLQLTDFEYYLQEKLDHICKHQLKSEIFVNWSQFVGISTVAREYYIKKRLRDGLTTFIEYTIRKRLHRQWFSIEDIHENDKNKLLHKYAIFLNMTSPYKGKKADSGTINQYQDDKTNNILNTTLNNDFLSPNENTNLFQSTYRFFQRMKRIASPTHKNSSLTTKSSSQAIHGFFHEMTSDNMLSPIPYHHHHTTTTTNTNATTMADDYRLENNDDNNNDDDDRLLYLSNPHDLSTYNIGEYSPNTFGITRIPPTLHDQYICYYRIIWKRFYKRTIISKRFKTVRKKIKQRQLVNSWVLWLSYYEDIGMKNTMICNTYHLNRTLKKWKYMTKQSISYKSNMVQSIEFYNKIQLQDYWKRFKYHTQLYHIIKKKDLLSLQHHRTRRIKLSLHLWKYRYKLRHEQYKIVPVWERVQKGLVWKQWKRYQYIIKHQHIIHHHHHHHLDCSYINDDSGDNSSDDDDDNNYLNIRSSRSSNIHQQSIPTTTSARMNISISPLDTTDQNDMYSYKKEAINTFQNENKNDENESEGESEGESESQSDNKNDDNDDDFHQEITLLSMKSPRDRFQPLRSPSSSSNNSTASVSHSAVMMTSPLFHPNNNITNITSISSSRNDPLDTSPQRVYIHTQDATSDMMMSPLPTSTQKSVKFLPNDINNSPNAVLTSRVMSSRSHDHTTTTRPPPPPSEITMSPNAVLSSRVLSSRSHDHTTTTRPPPPPPSEITMRPSIPYMSADTIVQIPASYHHTLSRNNSATSVLTAASSSTHQDRHRHIYDNRDKSHRYTHIHSKTLSSGSSSYEGTVHNYHEDNDYWDTHTEVSNVSHMSYRTLKQVQIIDNYAKKRALKKWYKLVRKSMHHKSTKSNKMMDKLLLDKKYPLRTIHQKDTKSFVDKTAYGSGSSQYRNMTDSRYDEDDYEDEDEYEKDLNKKDISYRRTSYIVPLKTNNLPVSRGSIRDLKTVDIGEHIQDFNQIISPRYHIPRMKSFQFKTLYHGISPSIYMKPYQKIQYLENYKDIKLKYNVFQAWINHYKQSIYHLYRIQSYAMITWKQYIKRKIQLKKDILDKSQKHYKQYKMHYVILYLHALTTERKVRLLLWYHIPFKQFNHIISKHTSVFPNKYHTPMKTISDSNRLSWPHILNKSHTKVSHSPVIQASSLSSYPLSPWSSTKYLRHLRIIKDTTTINTKNDNMIMHNSDTCQDHSDVDSAFNNESYQILYPLTSALFIGWYKYTQRNKRRYQILKPIYQKELQAVINKWKSITNNKYITSQLHIIQLRYAFHMFRNTYIQRRYVFKRIMRFHFDKMRLRRTIAKWKSVLPKLQNLVLSNVWYKWKNINVTYNSELHSKYDQLVMKRMRIVWKTMTTILMVIQYYRKYTRNRIFKELILRYHYYKLTYHIPYKTIQRRRAIRLWRQYAQLRSQHLKPIYQMADTYSNKKQKLQTIYYLHDNMSTTHSQQEYTAYSDHHYQSHIIKKYFLTYLQNILNAQQIQVNLLLYIQNQIQKDDSKLYYLNKLIHKRLLWTELDRNDAIKISSTSMYSHHHHNNNNNNTTNSQDQRHINNHIYDYPIYAADRMYTPASTTLLPSPLKNIYPTLLHRLSGATTLVANDTILQRSSSPTSQSRYRVNHQGLNLPLYNTINDSYLYNNLPQHFMRPTMKVRFQSVNDSYHPNYPSIVQSSNYGNTLKSNTIYSKLTESTSHQRNDANISMYNDHPYYSDMRVYRQQQQQQQQQQRLPISQNQSTAHHMPVLSHEILQNINYYIDDYYLAFMSLCYLQHYLKRLYDYKVRHTKQLKREFKIGLRYHQIRVLCAYMTHWLRQYYYHKQLKCTARQYYLRVIMKKWLKRIYSMKLARLQYNDCYTYDYQKKVKTALNWWYIKMSQKVYYKRQKRIGDIYHKHRVLSHALIYMKIDTILTS